MNLNITLTNLHINSSKDFAPKESEPLTKKSRNMGDDRSYGGPGNNPDLIVNG